MTPIAVTSAPALNIQQNRTGNIPSTLNNQRPISVSLCMKCDDVIRSLQRCERVRKRITKLDGFMSQMIRFEANFNSASRNIDTSNIP